MTAMCAHYYYRQPDQSRRLVSTGTWQETSAIDDLGTVASRVDQLVAQGYTVDAVELATTCPECHAVGTVPVRPKGMRQKAFEQMRYKPTVVCPVCDGDGVTHRHVILFGADSES